MKKLLLYIFILFTTTAFAQDSSFRRNNITVNINYLFTIGSGVNILIKPSYAYKITPRKELSGGIIFQPLRKVGKYTYMWYGGDLDLRIGGFVGYSYSLIREMKKSYWKISTQLWYGQGDFLYAWKFVGNGFEDVPLHTASAMYGIVEATRVRKFNNGWTGQFSINSGIKYVYGSATKTIQPVIGVGISLSKEF